jgi:hypothetical protein
MTACGEGVAPMRCLGLMALGCGKTFGEGGGGGGGGGFL